METIYFSNWVVPIFTSVSLFLVLSLVLIAIAFSLKRKDINSQDIAKLRSRMNLGKEISDTELLQKTSPTQFRKSLPYLIGAIVFLSWFLYPSLVGVYLIQKQSDGTLILKNCYHITLGTIQTNEKITSVGYQKILLRGRSAYSAVIQTEKKTYKTVSNSMDVISAGIKEIQK